MLYAGYSIIIPFLFLRSRFSLYYQNTATTPRGSRVKDPWARLPLVTTSLPACLLFHIRPENILLFLYIFSIPIYVCFFFFCFFTNIIAVRIGTYIFNRSWKDNNIIILSKLVFFFEFLSIFLKLNHMASFYIITRSKSRI